MLNSCFKLASFFCKVTKYIHSYVTHVVIQKKNIIPLTSIFHFLKKNSGNSIYKNIIDFDHFQFWIRNSSDTLVGFTV